MNEEIQVRFGADTGPLDTALRKMKGSVTESGEHSHRSFIHARNGAREFHKTIHEISAQSPVMGSALQLAISPVAGMFSVGALVLGQFHEKMKEVAAEARKFGDWAAKPSGSILKESMHETAMAVQEVRREYDKWLKSQEDSPAKKIMEGLHDSQAKLNFRAKLAKEADPDNAANIEKNRLQLQWIMERDTMAKIRKEKLKNAEELDIVQRDAEDKAGEARIKEAKKLNKTEEELQEHLKAKLGEKRGELEDTKSVLWASLKSMFPGEQKIEDVAKERVEEISSLNAQIQGTKARIDANNKAIEKETNEHKLVTEKLKELQAKQAELKSTFDSLSHSMEASRLALTAYPGTKVGAPIDVLHQAYNDQKSDFYKKFQAQKDAAYAPLHPYAQTKDALGQISTQQGGGKSTQELLRDIDKNIDELLKTATGKGLIINNP